jgi:hypothetical protein
MGCYDTIIIHKLVCPYCKAEIKNVEFQTKDGLSLLSVYHMGEYFPTDAPTNNIGVIASCPSCSKPVKDTRFHVIYTWIRGFIGLDDKQRLVKFELWKFERELAPDEQQIIDLTTVADKDTTEEKKQ